MMRRLLAKRRLEEAMCAARSAEREAASFAAELEAERVELVWAVNHELRTPLTAILGYVEVLLEDETWNPPPAHRSALERIHRNAERLHREMKEVGLLSPIREPARHLPAVG